MSVQTKLSPEDKDYLRYLRAYQKNRLEVFHYPDRRVTVGVKHIPGHTCARVFVSIASEEETKFRRKVGEFHVRWDFADYEDKATNVGVPYVVLNGLETSEDVAKAIAQIVGHV